MKVGLGVVSFGRPAFRNRTMRSIRQHCDVDFVTLVHDVAPVAKAKNIALRALLEVGCDWLFISEDDLEIRDPQAITGYIEACQESGWGHLMFHAHGGHNLTPKGVDGKVTFWSNCVGAWCIYSRESIETAGFFDEHFYNAWEHVEHSQRLALAGFTAPWPLNADATDSEKWIREQPGSIESSSIRHDVEWQRNFETGQTYWRENMPETYKMIWP